MLLLIDEIGAATDPEEGSALAMAFLEEYLSRGGRAVVTTHFSALKNFAASRPDAISAAMEFDEETGRPNYRIHPGLSGRSRALSVAREQGLPDRVLARARAILGEAWRRREEQESEAEAALERLRRAEKELERERDAARREQEKLARERERQAAERSKMLEEGLAGFEKARAELEKRVEREIDDDPAEHGAASRGFGGGRRREGARGGFRRAGHRGRPAGDPREDEGARRGRQGARPRIQARRDRPVARRGIGLARRRRKEDALRASPARAGGGRPAPQDRFEGGRPSASPSRSRRSPGKSTSSASGSRTPFRRSRSRSTRRSWRGSVISGSCTVTAPDACATRSAITSARTPRFRRSAPPRNARAETARPSWS